jgi:hypothetical protein
MVDTRGDVSIAPPIAHIEAGRATAPPRVEVLSAGLVAMALVAAGANAAMAWSWMDRSTGAAVYLGVVAALALVWVAALLRFPRSSQVLVVGAVDCLAAALVWLLTGPVRVPLGPADPRLRAGALGHPWIAALEVTMAAVALTLVLQRSRGVGRARTRASTKSQPATPVTIDGMTLPAWISIREAAFLARTDPDTMAARVAGAGVSLVAVRGSTRSFPFARAEELARAGLLRASSPPEGHG